MKISTRIKGSDCIVTLEGRLDAHSADGAVAAMRKALAVVAGNLIVDMGQVDFMSSAGLRAVLIAYRMMKERSGQLKLVNVQPFVQRVFELSQLTHLLGTEDEMLARIWGARGSIAAPLTSEAIEAKIVHALAQAQPGDVGSEDAARGFVSQLPETARGTVGGNTACVEVRVGERLFILDAGTGIRALGARLMADGFGRGQGKAHLLISHTHWDHIAGFPFFAPAYVKGNQIEICGGHKNLQARMNAQQVAEFFPVPIEGMGAEVKFRLLSEAHPEEIDGVTVCMARMQHPGDSFAYRLEYNDKSIAYATDAEIKDLHPDATQRYIDFFTGVDALIFDCQYTLEETIAKQDWGHSSPMVAADIASEAKARTLLMFHHDPAATDAQLEQSRQTAQDYLDHIAADADCTVELAREGLELTIGGREDAQQPAQEK